MLEEPADPECYVIMSDLALQEGRFTEAELALEKATTLLAEFTKSGRRKQVLIPRVHANLAAVSEWREHWAKAEEHLAAWLKFDRQSVGAMQRLGRVLFVQGKREEALQQFQAAAKVDENLAESGRHDGPTIRAGGRASQGQGIDGRGGQVSTIGPEDAAGRVAMGPGGGTTRCGSGARRRRAGD